MANAHAQQASGDNILDVEIVLHERDNPLLFEVRLERISCL
jgi:hypothetical protein